MTPIPILLYHSVAPEATEQYAPWCVHPGLFAAHLDVVLALGYTPLTISELVDATTSGTMPKRPIAITFDDGRADFTEHAVPVLESTGVASTMYVVTDRIGGASDWLRMPGEAEQPMMSWDDVRSAAAAGVEIGSHSATHRELDVIPAADLADELVVSRQRLSDQLGAPVRSFAYPHGYHSRSIIRRTRQAGYDSACSVKDRWSHEHDDRFALSRLFVWGTTSAADLESMLCDPAKRVPRSPQLERGLRAGWRAVRWVRYRMTDRPPRAA